jgi:hypothetical protein
MPAAVEALEEEETADAEPVRAEPERERVSL